LDFSVAIQIIPVLILVIILMYSNGRAEIKRKAFFSSFISSLVALFKGRVVKDTRFEKYVIFEYENKQIEYYYKTRQQLGLGVGSPTYPYDEHYIKVPTQGTLTLLLLQKAGDSIIGKTADALTRRSQADGCREIRVESTNESSNVLSDKRIYTNDEMKAKHFLADYEVRKIFSKYDNCIPPFLCVKDGVLILRLDSLLTDKVFTDPEVLKSHLSNMLILAHKLDVL